MPQLSLRYIKQNNIESRRGLSMHRRQFLFSSLGMLTLPKLNLANILNAEQAKAFLSGRGVMINFDGMIALAMGDPNRVSAGILDAHHHSPRMVISRVNGNGNSEVIATLEAKQLRGGLSIDLQAATRRAEKCKVDKYHCANGVRADENDLRWGIDFNELYPQAGALTIKGFV